MIESAVSARMRRRLADSARAFSATARNRGLLRAQLAFGAAWTAEWAFTVALGVVAFRDGGAGAVGVVAFVRIAPSALLAPVGTALADRFPRDQVLVWSCLIRAAATAAAALAHVAQPPRAHAKARLQLPRRPEQRCQDHRGQTDHEADDPARDVLADEHRSQEHGDPDDPAGGD